jgi:collagenase-like PrtC family protease
MIQIAEERMKEISDKQIQAIRKIVQSRDFNLSEYIKLKRILDSRVITRRDASAFLEYCFAKVHFERYFNGHHHKAYAACCHCKGRDNLSKIENLKTGKRHWCCQTCRSHITDPDIIDLPAGRHAKAGFRNSGSGGSHAGGYETEQQKAPGVLSGQQQCRDFWVRSETGQ